MIRRRKTATPIQLVIKRGLDISLSILALIILLPVLAVVAMLIKLTSPGPVLIRQRRCGFRETYFSMLKFRTMYHEVGDPSGVAQTTRGDTRITPLGSWLRRRSIDELPQLYNVLLGDMSLVGPRPHPVGMQAAGRRYEELVPYYRLRYLMRPGLTGLAQCSGFRGPTDDPAMAQARIDHDLAYVQNFTLLLDLKIVIKTLIRELPRGTGT